MHEGQHITAAPDVDHAGQSKLAQQVLAMQAAALLLGTLPRTRGHIRAGVTKNKGCKRNKVRARMARESRRRNR